MFDKLPISPSRATSNLPTAIFSFADGTPIFLSRTGYTGEQGFEIFVPTTDRGYLEPDSRSGEGRGVIPCGLAARDSVRAGQVLRFRNRTSARGHS